MVDERMIDIRGDLLPCLNGGMVYIVLEPSYHFCGVDSKITLLPTLYRRSRNRLKMLYPKKIIRPSNTWKSLKVPESNHNGDSEGRYPMLDYGQQPAYSL